MGPVREPATLNATDITVAAKYLRDLGLGADGERLSITWDLLEEYYDNMLKALEKDSLLQLLNQALVFKVSLKELIGTVKANPRPAFHGEQPALSRRMEAKVQKALEFIDKKGNVKALSVAKVIDVKEGTFRKHYVHILKQRGVQNDGNGYYRPKEGDKT